MNAHAAGYPIELDEARIRQILPHRGEILCVRRVTLLGRDDFVGHAIWSGDLPILQGHFPGMPVVPGVLLVEAVAQAAGAALLARELHEGNARERHLGMLAGIRKCSFRCPVHVNEYVRLDIHARRMSETTVFISSRLRAEGDDVAGIEILLVTTPVDSLHV